MVNFDTIYDHPITVFRENKNLPKTFRRHKIQLPKPDPEVLSRFQQLVDNYTERGKIGVGITTHNRYEIFKNAYKNIVKYTPVAKIVVVDDASKKPVSEATFRFPKTQGVAKAKNKCLELLDDCDHIFLFDDDIWPLYDHWYVPYVVSKEPHLSYNWGPYLYQDENYVYYTTKHPIGAMLYFDHQIMEKLGGFDTSFGRYGAEHTEFTRRIHLAGLTSEAFIDFKGSETIFYAEDRHYCVISSFSESEQMRWNAFNRGTIHMTHLLKKYAKSGIPYMPYKG